MNTSSEINNINSTHIKETNVEDENLTKINKDSKEITKPKTKEKRVVKKVNEVLEKTNEKVNKNVDNVEIRKQVWKIKLLKVAGGLEKVVKIT